MIDQGFQDACHRSVRCLDLAGVDQKVAAAALGQVTPVLRAQPLAFRLVLRRIERSDLVGIVLEGNVGQAGSGMGIEPLPVVLRADHCFRLDTGQFLAGRVPEGDHALGIENEGWNRGCSENR